MNNTDKDSMALEETELSIFNALFNHSPDASIILALDTGKVAQCNDAALEILQGTREQITGMSIDEISPEYQPCGRKSAALAAEKIDIAFQKGRLRFEWVHKRLDHQDIYCDVVISPLKLGADTYVLGSWREVSELKKREEELKIANERFDLAVKGSDVGIWQWNLVTGELIWSDRLFSQLGYEPQEVKPSFELWEEIIHPDDFDRVMSDLNDHLQHNAPYFIELRNKCKNGEYKWFKASGYAKRNEKGEPLNMAGSMDDIDEKKNAEIANKRLLELLDASSDFIGQADINKNITYLNPAFKQLVGYGQEGKRSIPDWHPPEDIKKLNEVIFPQAINNGTWSGEISLIDVEGNTIPCSMLEIAHKNSKGEYETFSAIMRDISDLKQQEAELLKQTKISEHQSKLAAIGRLASGVGHEINNPLAIIKGYIESSLFELKAGRPLDQEKLVKRLDKINSAIDRITKITRGLRSFARNDVENIECFPLANMIEESCSLVQEIYNKEGINLDIADLETFQGTFICGDRGKFQQVLMNLLGNAKDAVEDALVKNINVALGKQNGMIRLEVKDSGVGVPDAIKEKIFEPFYTTKDVNKGTGLGLSFVREYVEEMNGTVEVNSVFGEPTTFALLIPEASEETAKKINDAKKQTSAIAAHSLNILIAEDEEVLCELYTELLESEGHQVTVSSNGMDALSTLLENPDKFDLVLSDMRMPQMGGLELAKKIRSSNTIKQPKFMLTTGGVDVNLESEVNELTNLIDGYLLKPFETSQLLSAINKLF